MDEPAPEHGPDDVLRAEILRIAEQRGSANTLCPSDAARSVGGEQWRDLMPAARRIAFELAGEGRVDVTQRGERVEPDARGPIRIRWIDAPSRSGGVDTTARTSSSGLAPVPYAYAASVDTASRLVFGSGACPLTADGVVAGDSFAAQATRALENLSRALGGSGAVLADVVHLRVLVASADRAHLVEAWDALAAVLGTPAPPSTLMGVAVLGYPGQLVELEAVAAVGAAGEASRRQGPVLRP
ncbi:DUF3253 domain-containing protein [Arthrobacter sp. NamB2]|uniref:DUF3253 domain-containing protein n=1 Tax=Arthrobacter sp. NamB2 TaxID=2576035 RepID=UPI0026CD0A8F|nr:DUF3253 domain-containing protein [Arthrobacter sp. NamB2]